MSVLCELLRFLIGCYFVRSGAAKMGAPNPFLATIMDYGLTGVQAARVLASIIPPLEFFGGLALASNVSPLPAAATLFLLLCVFSAAMIIVLARKSPPEDCGCGTSPTRVTAGLVVRNTILALALMPTLILSHPLEDNKNLALSCLVIALIVTASFLRYRKLIEAK